MAAAVFHATYYTLAGIRAVTSDDVSIYDLRTRAEACARVGYRGIGVSWPDLDVSLAKYGAAGIRSILRDNGIEYFEIDALSGWFATDGNDPFAMPANRGIIDAAERIGAHHIRAVGSFGPTDATVDEMRDGFARVCAAARDAGTSVALEMIAISNINTLALAVAVVGETWRENGSLALDIWHTTRAGVSNAEIAALPSGMIGWVEINDGTREPIGDPLDEQLDHRLLCGDGEFDIAGYLAAIAQSGYDGPYGVEVISEAIRALPLEAAARVTIETARRQFADS